MIPSWTSANRVDTKPLERWYRSKSQISESPTGKFRKTTFEHHRYVTHTFSYVGMSKATAILCAAAMRTRYLRRFWNWTYGVTAIGWAKSDYYDESVATVQLTHTAGHMYQVDVQVNEETILYSGGSPANLEQAFVQAYGAWEYDED